MRLTAACVGREAGSIKRIFLALIRFYQKAISPFRPPCCRFYPTCSSYALEAVSRFGAIRGGLMAVWRILRCNPLGKGGYEPVPERWIQAFFPAKVPARPETGLTGRSGEKEEASCCGGSERADQAGSTTAELPPGGGSLSL